LTRQIEWVGSVSYNIALRSDIKFLAVFNLVVGDFEILLERKRVFYKCCTETGNDMPK
jgi:hypothetical protein